MCHFSSFTKRAYFNHFLKPGTFKSSTRIYYKKLPKRYKVITRFRFLFSLHQDISLLTVTSQLAAVKVTWRRVLVLQVQLASSMIPTFPFSALFPKQFNPTGLQLDSNTIRKSSRHNSSHAYIVFYPKTADSIRSSMQHSSWASSGEKHQQTSELSLQPLKSAEYFLRDSGFFWWLTRGGGSGLVPIVVRTINFCDSSKIFSSKRKIADCC